MTTMNESNTGITSNLGDYQSAVEAALDDVRKNAIIEQIWKHDHTVWSSNPAEISNRLGWLHSPEVMLGAIPEITAFVDEARGDGFTHALLLGMGGSSLAPEVFRFTFGVRKNDSTDRPSIDLAVLDSTDPGAVLAHDRRLDPARTLYIVSTKSGGTVETFSFFKYFYNRVADVLGREKAGAHFIAITDPGSGLQQTATTYNFRKTFLNDPNIGGRYSALSYFGLVPAALIGVDLKMLLTRAIAMTTASKDGNLSLGNNNSPVCLGAIIGELAAAGRDKLTIITSPAISSFGAWAEQLIAESTGKEGKGILPVDGEIIASPGEYADDRLFVYLRLDGDGTHDHEVQELINAGHPVVQLTMSAVYDLGAEFFRWEIATVVAGRRLGINPFDQPNVESAKVLARQMVAAYEKDGKLPQLVPTLKSDGITVYSDESAGTAGEALKKFLARANSGSSYVALQAYLKPDIKTDAALQRVRTKIQISWRVATTAGYGPRFLHSTGQLHKGDAGNGLFIQFTADMPEDAPIPEEAGSAKSSMTFGVLKTAQSLGDRQALVDAGRRVIRFDLGKDIEGALNKLAGAIG